ncbi:hypothetical protein [Lysinibacillus telephonicus]|uniref:hypothetical protein n=1 Tax=Lysinibacillus telephonicus TaxID=1714840 RepID=UPI0037D3F9EC
MNTIKVVVFFLGIFLINYVGGMPTDLKNLFITHTIFLVPYLLDFHPYLKIKFDKFVLIIVRVIYTLGIIVLVINIFGIFGIIQVNVEKKEFFLNGEYWLPFSFGIGYYKYILFASLVYVAVFMGTLGFRHMVTIQESIQTDLEEQTT